MILTPQEGLTYSLQPHGYKWRGVPQPYTSGILKDLGLSADFSRADPERVELKGAIGTAFHLGAYLLIRGNTLEPHTIDPLVAPYLTAFELFLGQAQPRPLAAELPLYSQVYAFGTTLDLVCELNGVVALIDYKTSSQISPSVEYQLWSQEIAWNECHPSSPIAGRFALHLRPDGSYRLKPFNDRPAENWAHLVYTWHELKRRGKPVHV